MIIVQIEPYENGAHENIIGTVSCPEGWAVLPDDIKPEHFPFFEIDEIAEGVITKVIDGEYPAEPVLTAEERRRHAYETEAVIEYEGKTITVDEARAICGEYQFEDTERAAAILTELKAKITVAKEAIRAREVD